MPTCLENVTLSFWENYQKIIRKFRSKERVQFCKPVNISLKLWWFQGMSLGSWCEKLKKNPWVPDILRVRFVLPSVHHQSLVHDFSMNWMISTSPCREVFRFVCLYVIGMYKAYNYQTRAAWSLYLGLYRTARSEWSRKQAEKLRFFHK